MQTHLSKERLERNADLSIWYSTLQPWRRSYRFITIKLLVKEKMMKIVYKVKILTADKNNDQNGIPLAGLNWNQAFSDQSYKCQNSNTITTKPM